MYFDDYIAESNRCASGGEIYDIKLLQKPRIHSFDKEWDDASISCCRHSSVRETDKPKQSMNLFSNGISYLCSFWKHPFADIVEYPGQGYENVILEKKQKRMDVPEDEEYNKAFMTKSPLHSDPIWRRKKAQFWSCRKGSIWRTPIFIFWAVCAMYVLYLLLSIDLSLKTNNNKMRDDVLEKSHAFIRGNIPLRAAPVILEEMSNGYIKRQEYSNYNELELHSTNSLDDFENSGYTSYYDYIKNQ